MREFGVHSEVGKLRTVMVCRPSLAHQRLTPGNCHELLFDDVIWVHEAQKDHYDFALKMQERGVEVLELHDLLAETLEDPEARNSCSTGELPTTLSEFRTAAFIRPWLDEMPPAQLAAFLIGGIAISDLPDATTKRYAERGIWRHRIRPAADSQHAVSARPVVLDLQRRDLQSMFWPARRPETLLQRAIYKFHPPSRAATSRSGGAIPTKISPTRPWKAAMSCRSARALS